MYRAIVGELVRVDEHDSFAVQGLLRVQYALRLQPRVERVVVPVSNERDRLRSQDFIDWIDRVQHALRLQPRVE